MLIFAMAVVAVAGAAAAGTIAVPHRWGVTRIEAPVERIVSLSYTGADILLALGVTPRAYRAWYGGDETGLWPWAAARLGDADPVVLRGEIDIERVALLGPDLIDAMWSGISRAEYEALSRIAPVLAPAEGTGDFGMSWEQMTRILGKATGRRMRATTVISDLDARFAAIRAVHPGWAGQTAVVAWPSGPRVYAEDDARTRVFTRLGFHVPEAVKRLARGAFFFPLDPELTRPIDADLLVWLDVGFGVAGAREMPLRRTLRAVAEGRELVTDPDLSAALSYATPLSLPYALERLVPMIERAVDGDPATVVPSARAAGLAP